MTTQVARLLLRRIVHKVALSCLQTPFTPLLIYGRPSCHPHWSSTLLCVFAGFTCNSVHAPLSVACNPSFSSNQHSPLDMRLPRSHLADHLCGLCKPTFSFCALLHVPSQFPSLLMSSE